MKYVRLFRGEFVRELIEMRRYPLESAIPIIVMGLAFAFFYAFTKSIVHNVVPDAAFEALEENAAKLFAGYIVWVLVFWGTHSIFRKIFNELQTGILEQVFLSPISPSIMLCARSLATMFIGILSLPLVGAIGILVTGVHLNFNPLHFFPLIFFIGMGATGMGLVLGGITLLYKRIYILANIMVGSTIFLTAPAFAEAGSIAWAIKLFPIAQGMKVFRMAMAENVGIVELARSGELGWLIAGSVLFLVLGIIIFGILERIARKHGLLGQY